MKKLSTVVIFLSSLLAGSLGQTDQSRLLAACKTMDHRFTVYVMDNENAGPTQASSFTATIYNSSNQVEGNYLVKSNAGRPHSISFGQFMYTDVKTGGKMFTLAFGSTNYRHITLTAVLSDNAEINEIDPVCSVH